LSSITPNAQQQIMVSLAYIAYVDELIPGIPSPDATIKADLITALSATAPTPIPPIAGLWNLVWGPVSYTVPGAYYQDNMMYVAQFNGSSAITQYAVVVRGTNGKAWLDWLIDDLDVLDMMPWPYGSALSSAVGMISESTNVALTTLLSMQDPTGGSLFDFLTAQMSSSSVTQAGICFTGHSLGGTLASTLALHARDIQATWDPSSKATVTTINFAAPSAGDDNFAAYFETKFAYTGSPALPYWTPPSGFSSYADFIRNSIDIAPMFWNYTTMRSAPSTYDWHLPPILPSAGTSEVVDMFADDLQSLAYTQPQSTQPVWPGTIESGLKWVAEVEYQHVDGYPNLLGVPQLLSIFSSQVPKQAVAAMRARRLAIAKRLAASA